MLNRNRLFCVALAAMLCLSFSGCASSPKESVDDTPATEVLEEQDEAGTEAPPSGDESGLVTDIAGNINYTYKDDLAVVDISGTKYIYYNDTSFFFVDSYPDALPGTDALDEIDAEEYFVAAEESFNEGDWANGKMVTDIELVNFNGVDIWVTEIEMDHSSGTEFTCVAAVVYLDGSLTSFTFITDNGSYEASVTEFANTLMSLRAA